MARPLLSVEGLEVTLATEQGTGQVLQRVSLSVDGGERIGLVGESGCGKA
jgi:ABC-type glutathione transport system ATPase component